MGRRQKAINGHQVQPKRPQAEEIARLAANVRQLINMQRHELAVEVLLQLQALDPGHVEGLLLQGELALAAGEKTKALHSLLAASFQLPTYPRVYWLLAKLHTEGRQDLAAISALLRYVELKPQDSKGMLTLAALYAEAGYVEQSSYWMRRSLRLEPFRCLKPVAEPQRKLRVLALMTAESSEWRVNRKTFATQITEGHNNLTTLLDTQHIEVWRLFVDEMGSAPEVVRKLPDVDLIYNGITDAERCAEALVHAQKLCDRLGKPVVNQPTAVLDASREGNYARFKDSPDVIAPKSVKYTGVQSSAKTIVEQAIAEQQFTLPVIIRLAGFQGGKYMHLVEDPERHDFTALDHQLAKQPQTVYVIQYHNVSYVDERLPNTQLYPKYRAFMVGGELYPVHLFNGPEFNVHLKTAKQTMQENPWLVDNERHFCDSPTAHLGERQWQALELAMREAGLDYNGIDFSVATSPEDEGKVVVFEINPAMRNWVKDLPEGDHVQQAWKEITQAVHRHFCEKANVAPWAFNLPEGKPPELTSEDILTLRLHITGKVQGVGFRQWFANELEARTIPGWVRNLADGSVEAVIHGKLGDLQPLCDEVPSGPEAAEVKGVNIVPWQGSIPEGIQVLETAAN